MNGGIMRKLVYYVAVSIDGYIADLEGRFDAFLTGGDHNTVVFGEYSDALPIHARGAQGVDSPLTLFDTVLIGWNTLLPALDAGIPSPYPHLRQVVASRRSPAVDSSLTVTHDPCGTARALKQEDGLDIWLCGGGELAGALLPEIDGLVLKRHPVVLGSGIPLFGRASHSMRRFVPTRRRSFDSGVVIEEYAAP